MLVKTIQKSGVRLGGAFPAPRNQPGPALKLRLAQAWVQSSGRYTEYYHSRVKAPEMHFVITYSVPSPRHSFSDYFLRTTQAGDRAEALLAQGYTEPLAQRTRPANSGTRGRRGKLRVLRCSISQPLKSLKCSDNIFCPDPPC